MATTQRNTSSIQWWFERLDTFPDFFLSDDACSDDASIEPRLIAWLLEEVGRLLPAARSAVYLVHPEELLLQHRAVSDPEWRMLLQQVGAEQISNGHVAWVLKSGRPAVMESAAASKPHHVMILPLMTARSIIGICLILRNRMHGEVSVEQLKILSVMAHQFSSQIENQRLFRKLEAQNRNLDAQVKQRTQELESSLKTLEQLNREIVTATQVKSRFLANTSHELRTPLNSILGFLHLLKDGLYTNEAEQAEFISHALDSGQHLLSLINDLLDLAKIEAGKMAVRCEAVRLAEVLDDVRALMQVQARQKGLALTFDVRHAGSLAVLADARRLKQILANLVGNAIKFTCAGSVRLVAQPSPDGGGAALITISDTGVGIAEDILDRVGKPFVQGDGDTTRRFGGTGLGLAISRALVGLMQGSFTIASAGAGEGTTVMVRLPLAGSAVPGGPPQLFPVDCR